MLLELFSRFKPIALLHVSITDKQLVHILVMCVCFSSVLSHSIYLFKNDILCITFNFAQNSITLYTEEIFKFFPFALTIA